MGVTRGEGSRGSFEPPFLIPVNFITPKSPFWLCAEEFKSQQERPEMAVRGLFDVTLKARIERNRHLVKQTAREVLFCGKQGIALRGKVEKIIRGDHQETAKDGKQSKVRQLQ